MHVLLSQTLSAHEGKLRLGNTESVHQLCERQTWGRRWSSRPGGWKRWRCRRSWSFLRFRQVANFLWQFTCLHFRLISHGEPGSTRGPCLPPLDSPSPSIGPYCMELTCFPCIHLPPPPSHSHLRLQSTAKDVYSTMPADCLKSALPYDHYFYLYLTMYGNGIQLVGKAAGETSSLFDKRHWWPCH